MIEPFLQVPPFPGARGHPLMVAGTSRFAPEEVRRALVRNRVGGTFWAGPSPLAVDGDIILVPGSMSQLAAMLGVAGSRPVAMIAAAGLQPPPAIATIRAPFDPWTLADQASEVWFGADHPLAVVAALLGKPVRQFGGDLPGALQPDPVAHLLQTLANSAFANPFDGTPWSVIQAIAQLGEWRRLIEGNRIFDAIYGVARWKRPTVDPLLWDGTGPVRHARKARSDLAGMQVAAWKSRTPPSVLKALEARGAKIAELEDGMIRSVGLGANCVPPLSVIVDIAGVYFDPNRPSDLETLLECGELPVEWVERAESLRSTLVHAGISKYGLGKVPYSSASNQGRRILVTGQVEDDRSVISGGGNCTNLDLLARARALEPDAWIIYKPHPDVEAGHRKGHVPDAEALRYANTIERVAPITALIEQVDGLHVITSLAGFEALLRGKAVTTHGQPFYAGWGLTRNLGPANPRRTRKRSLAELVAATLIGYPRYVDPVTRLPCPPEVLVARMAGGQAQVTSMLITLRQFQGKIALLWKALTGGRR